VTLELTSFQKAVSTALHCWQTRHFAFLTRKASRLCKSLSTGYGLHSCPHLSSETKEQCFNFFLTHFESLKVLWVDVQTNNQTSQSHFLCASIAAYLLRKRRCLRRRRKVHPAKSIKDTGVTLTAGVKTSNTKKSPI